MARDSRRYGRLAVVVGVLATLLVAALLATQYARRTTGGDSSGAAPAPARTATPPTASGSASGSFRQAQGAMSDLVDARATWHAPDALSVDEPASIGLSLGDTDHLRGQIEVNLPDLPTRDGGDLKVGTDVSAELFVDESFIAVQPDRAINASFGSQPGLLWTWTVRPLRPASELRIRAHLTMTVPGTNAVLIEDLPLTLRAQRTLAFTAYQVFSSWTTWAAVVASAAAAFGWWRRRRTDRPARAAVLDLDGAVQPGRGDAHADALVEAERPGP
jgi:hypothetical protein